MNWIKVLTFQFFIGLIFLEIMSFLGSKAQLFIVNDTPALYFLANKEEREARYVIARTEQDPWGAWWRKNSISRQVSACFDVEIRTNEIGARDTSFERLEGKSIVLLGDSFAEGFGVAYRNTAQYILEQMLDVNILNFGVAGNFGPLQQYIIYRDLAKNYEHVGVLIFVLPANDFTDNDKSFWEGVAENRLRYRPYVSYVDGNLTPWYFPEAVPTNTFGKYSNSKHTENADVIGSDNGFDMKRFLVNNFWLSNPLRSFNYLISKRDVTGGSYYLSAKEHQQIDLVNAYSRIVKLSEGKPVSFVILPTQRDFIMLEGNRSVLQEQYWYRSLQKLAIESGGSFIDLLDFRTNDVRELFHICDGHWSIPGNKWAASAIASRISLP